MGKRFLKNVVRKLLRAIDDPKKLQSFAEPLFWILGYRGSVNRSRIPASVAVIKLDRMGDVVLCSRFLAELRLAWPKSRVTLLVRESLVDLARLCPDVDEVIGVPVQEGKMIFDPLSQTYCFWGRQLLAWFKVCHRTGLWRRRFDVVLVPRWGIDYYGAILLAYLTGARKRWGVTEMANGSKAVENHGFDQLLTQVIEGKSEQHEFLLNQAFLKALGLSSSGKMALVSWVTGDSRKRAVDLLSALGVNVAKPFIVLCMGAGQPSKMWPAQRYADLCRKVFNPETVQLVTFGALEEKRLGLQLKEKSGDVVINLEGKVPLELLPATVSLGALYIGSDTGIMHLAAAAGLPVLAISGHPLDGDPLWPESPLRFGPYGVASGFVQPKTAAVPCTRYCVSEKPHCILNVSVEQAATALNLLLDENGAQKTAEDFHATRR
jgi:ADP-heptose:LPS heptosyltransferase